MSSKVDISRIRQEMKTRNQWICWEVGFRNGDETKLPKKPDSDGFAKADDPDTWGTIMEAKSKMLREDMDGIGYVFSESGPYVGIDLDKCRDPETGEWEDWALDVMQDVGGWIEISPSGTGAHIIVKGTIPGNKNRKGNVEMYETARFFTVTGDLVDEQGQRLDDDDDTPEIVSNQQGIDVVYDRFLADEETETANEVKVDIDLSDNDHLNVGDSNISSSSHAGNLEDLPVEDREIVRAAKGAKNGYKFTQLWRGNWDAVYSGVEDSHSEGDMGFADMLAFWCSGDPERMDRIFRVSGLMRPKWDSVRYSDGSTYGERTIEKAIAQVDSYYDDDHYEQLVEEAANVPDDDMEPPEETESENEDEDSGTELEIDADDESDDNDDTDGQSSTDSDSNSGGSAKDASRSRDKPTSSVVDDISVETDTEQKKSENTDSESEADNEQDDSSESRSRSSSRRTRNSQSVSTVAQPTSQNNESSDDGSNGGDDDYYTDFNFDDTQGDDKKKEDELTSDEDDEVDDPETEADAGTEQEDEKGDVDRENNEDGEDGGNEIGISKEEGVSIFDEMDDDDEGEEDEGGSTSDTSDETQDEPTVNVEGESDESNTEVEPYDPEEHEGAHVKGEAVGTDSAQTTEDTQSTESAETSRETASTDGPDRKITSAAGGELESRLSGTGNKHIPDKDDIDIQDLAIEIAKLDEEFHETRKQLINDIEIEDDKLERLYQELIEYEKIVEERENQLETILQLLILICKAQDEPIFSEIAKILASEDQIPEADLLNKTEMKRYNQRQREKEVENQSRTSKRDGVQDVREGDVQDADIEEESGGFTSRFSGMINRKNENEEKNKTEDGSGGISFSDIF